jgi:hypothetical protein
MTTEQPKRKKLNTRWRKGAVRYSSDRTIEHARWVRQPDGARRLEKDAPTEARFVERLHQQPGWRNGARVRVA